MAYEIPGQTLGTLKAAADLSALQYRFAGINSSGQATQNTTAGADVLGVVQNKPKQGEAVTIFTSGVSKVVAGGTVAAGAKVMSDNVGRAVTATSTNRAVGYALEGGAVGEIIPVLLKDLGAQP